MATFFYFCCWLAGWLAGWQAAMYEWMHGYFQQEWQHCCRCCCSIMIKDDDDDDDDGNECKWWLLFCSNSNEGYFFFLFRFFPCNFLALFKMHLLFLSLLKNKNWKPTFCFVYITYIMIDIEISDRDHCQNFVVVVVHFRTYSKQSTNVKQQKFFPVLFLDSIFVVVVVFLATIRYIIWKKKQKKTLSFDWRETRNVYRERENELKSVRRERQSIMMMMRIFWEGKVVDQTEHFFFLVKVFFWIRKKWADSMTKKKKKKWRQFFSCSFMMYSWWLSISIYDDYHTRNLNFFFCLFVWRFYTEKKKNFVERLSQKKRSHNLEKKA